MDPRRRGSTRSPPSSRANAIPLAPLLRSDAERNGGNSSTTNLPPDNTATPRMRSPVSMPQLIPPPVAPPVAGPQTDTTHHTNSTNLPTHILNALASLQRTASSSSNSTSTDEGAHASSSDPIEGLLGGLLLAQLLQSVSEPNASSGATTQRAAPIQMPVPITMPEPTFPSGHPLMPEPQIVTSHPPPQQSPSMSSVPPPPPPPPPGPELPRPPSPDDEHIARGTLVWRLFLAPLCSRLHEALYDGEHSALPEPVSGHVSYLKLDGYSACDTVDHMCALLQFLMDNRWEEQVPERFVDAMRVQPGWPAKLKDKPLSQHVEYAWMLMNGLLAVVSLKPYLEPAPPSTIAGIVERVFPHVPHGTVPPSQFNFTARELVEEDFIIQPTTNLLDHLKLVGNAISVYTLSTEEIQLLMGYNNNRAARAIGMAGLGSEYMHSYAALVEGEFHECYRLPISLGIFKIDDTRVKRGQYDDLTVVTGVIRMYRNDRAGDRTPHLLASRVLAIEEALRRRRHWYNRLRRDIHKRKKAEPWMFWGAVLAVFFGVCTVIQTVTSVWSLVVSLS
ncbi:hypothetical protein FKP32DRAFT_855610 [Trametes sanguinea]|nr:hypothetical protein FKP32DRAFT_855610 [Trametes sanguinea]